MVIFIKKSISLPPKMIRMKGHIYKIFLFTACFVLLAHAIVPHHSHYNRPVCFHGGFKAERCDHHDHLFDHQAHECGGHHAGHSLCIISDFFAPAQTQELDIHINTDIFVISADMIIAENNIINTAFAGLPFRRNPYVIAYHDVALEGALTLRAPPE